jgi:hypothetical protein
VTNVDIIAAIEAARRDLGDEVVAKCLADASRGIHYHNDFGVQEFRGSGGRIDITPVETP